MRTVIIFILTIVTLSVSANGRSEYADKVERFCRLRKGFVVGNGGCNDIIQKIMIKHHLTGQFRFDITDSTNNLWSKVNAGDYIYYNNAVFKGGSRTGSHFAIVIGFNEYGHPIIAEQNADYGRGALIIEDSKYLPVISGCIEVYSFVKRTKKGKAKYSELRGSKPRKK